MRVTAERARAYVEADHEEVPTGSTGKIEERSGNTIGRDTDDVTEDEGHHQGRKDRTDEEPRITEDGLLIGSLEVTLGHDPEQVTVAVDLSEVDVKEVGLGFDL